MVACQMNPVDLSAFSLQSWGIRGAEKKNIWGTRELLKVWVSGQKNLVGHQVLTGYQAGVFLHLKYAESEKQANEAV